MQLRRTPDRTLNLQRSFAAVALVSYVSVTCLDAQAQVHERVETGTEVSWLPGWSQVRLKLLELQRDTAQQVEIQTVSEQPAARFIVRLRDDPVLEGIAKNYRRDQARAEATFEDWCERQTGLEGLKLLGASYSGELVIGLPANDPYRRTPAEILATFERMDNLVYAELDAIAHPSKRGN